MLTVRLLVPDALALYPMVAKKSSNQILIRWQAPTRYVAFR